MPKIDVKHSESLALFEREWTNFIENFIKKNSKVPDDPGPGWLASVAACHNLCTATMRKQSGQYKICGKKVKENENYYCGHHLELMEKINTKREKSKIVQDEIMFEEKAVWE